MTTPEEANTLGGAVPDNDPTNVRKRAERLAAELASANRQLLSLGSETRQLVRSLALRPGRDNIRLLMEVFARQAGMPNGEIDMPHIAMLLAAAQSPQALSDTLFASRGGTFEHLRRYTYQELLLRGVDPDRYTDLFNGSYWYEHPVWLPRTLRDFEEAVPTDVHSGSDGYDLGPLGSFGEPVDPATSPPAVGPDDLRNLLTVALHHRMAAAPEASQWTCETGAFASDTPLEPGDLPRLVPTLPVECVARTPYGGQRFELARSNLAEVWKLLFTVAAAGVPYSRLPYGATSRATTWISLSGLAGAHADAGVDDVERLAREATWFRFRSDAEWFHNDLGLDFGIVALSADRRRLTLLAGTGTD